MGICSAKSTVEDPLNYAQIQATTGIMEEPTKTALNIAVVPQSPTSASSLRRRSSKRKSYKNYRIGITKSFIDEMQQLLYASHIENNEFYRIPSTVNCMILQYLPTYYRIYGIGKNLVSSLVLSDFERLHLFETKLSSLNHLYRGHNKYFIKSYASEIYGIGSNSFDGLCLNCFDDNYEYALKHITSIYNYFNLYDENESIELISDSMFSNDILIKLKNGSIYQSSLTMDKTTTEWKRIFIKPEFDDLLINKHLSIISIKCGLLHTLLLANNGTVYSFGANINGQCGLGFISHETQDKIQIIPTFIEENVNITSINCGEHHSSAVDESGSLWCFGYNKYNQCGLCGVNIATVVTKPMMAFTNIGMIVKSECGESFTVYLTDKGVYGGFGKIIVSTLERANITEWKTDDELLFKDISSGLNHVMLIGNDNKIYCHGSNEYYKCGLKTGKAAKPTQVKYHILPDLKPSAVIAGTNNSIVIFDSTVD